MRRTARRLVALLGAAVLLVLALAAGPAAAVGSMMIRGGRNTGFVPLNGPPTDGTRVLIALVSAAAIALVAGTALAFDRRSRRQLAAAEGPAGDVGQVCDDVVCDWQPSRPEVEERRAA